MNWDPDGSPEIESNFLNISLGTHIIGVQFSPAELESTITVFKYVVNVHIRRHDIHSNTIAYCRCYNCGEFANHLASQCSKGPMPKRCHNCKSEEHLIEGCPTLPVEKQVGQQ